MVWYNEIVVIQLSRVSNNPFNLLRYFTEKKKNFIYGSDMTRLSTSLLLRENNKEIRITIKMGKWYSFVRGSKEIQGDNTISCWREDIIFT